MPSLAIADSSYRRSSQASVHFYNVFGQFSTGALTHWTKRVAFSWQVTALVRKRDVLRAVNMTMAALTAVREARIEHLASGAAKKV